MEKEVFAIEGGFGYRIVIDGRSVTEQLFAPGLSGFVLMTEAEAREFADSDLARMTAG